jgi:CPA1 family monovalent cation:H+ antiporter
VEALLLVVGLITVVVAASALARKLGLLTPIVLVIVGLALALVPGFPVPQLDPQLVLIGVLPPLLYVAALQTSVPAFHFNLRPILLLAVGLTCFTTAVVGLVVYTLLPGVPLAACLAFGAVVAPPDAIAATAVARRIGLPRRLVTILEGESLLNDATALVLFRVATAAAVGAAIGWVGIGTQVLLAAGGGLAVGAIGALVASFFHRRTDDPLLDNAISLITPFAVTAVAETIHASAVVAVVVTGLYLGHRLPTLMSAQSRLQMGAFWRMVTFLLEGLVFLFVGLQLSNVVGNLRAPLSEVAGLTAAVLATVIVTRFVWVYPATYLTRLIPRVRERDPAPPLAVPTIIAWAGMRGVVTLAAALALPAALPGGERYPRQLFIWLAFTVIVGTLLLQGTTLPLLARRLRLSPDDPMQDILAEAAVQQEASKAARQRLEAHADGVSPEMLDRLRRLTELRSNTAWERLGHGQETPSRAYVRLRLEMLDAERQVFRAARDSGRIPEEILIQAQRDMDLEESMLERTGEV